MSYQAIVAAVHTRPHPKADRLQIGTVAGNQVVVGMDVKDGELGVFFGPDGQLSHEFCLSNGLYSGEALQKLAVEMNQPDLVSAQGEHAGFFSANRRVRSQNFRGVKSDGFWVPLSYFHYLYPYGVGPSEPFKAGFQFDTLNGQLICEKYYAPATKLAIARGLGKAKKQNVMFPKVGDTAQFRFLTEIPQDAIVYITEKLHGTSARYGLVLEDVPMARWKQRLNSFTVSLFGHMFFRPEEQWVYLNGSRNVVLEQAAGPGFYGTNEFRYDVVRGLELRKGEVLYGEIVGYVHDDLPIMPPQDTTKLKDKAIEQQYGKKMTYSYGCQPGEHKLFIYKIMVVNEDGQGLELSWHQMKQRCEELGLQTVPLLGWTGRDLNHVKDEVDRYLSGPSLLDHSHMREGVVLRIESAHGTEHVKAKSWEFGVLEGYIKEQDSYVDTEEIS